MPFHIQGKDGYKEAEARVYVGAVKEDAGAFMEGAIRGEDGGIVYLIHPPKWHGGGEGEEEALGQCYTQVLQEAVENGYESVAIPLLGVGDAGSGNVGVAGVSPAGRGSEG